VVKYGVLCRVCARVFLRLFLSFPSSLPVRLKLAAVFMTVGARVFFVSLLVTGVARDAGRGLLYYGAGLGVARGDDVDSR
jgi:hypothetical protein